MQTTYSRRLFIAELEEEGQRTENKIMILILLVFRLMGSYQSKKLSWDQEEDKVCNKSEKSPSLSQGIGQLPKYN